MTELQVDKFRNELDNIMQRISTLQDKVDDSNKAGEKVYDSLWNANLCLNGIDYQKHLLKVNLYE